MNFLSFSQSAPENDSLNSFPEKRIAFSHLSIEDGLSQNSVLSIAQDSIGYMWFVTQDGLNRYDGRSFKIYNKQFEDITRPTFSRLGRVYIDKQNKLWIITNSGKLEYYHQKRDSFQYVERFKNVSSIFQDKSLNTYIGTYGKGLFKIDAITKDTIQLFKPKDINRITYDFYQLDDNIIIATSGAIFKLNKNNDYESLVLNGNNNIHFSSIEQTHDGTLWFGSYGYGLYNKKPEEEYVYALKKSSNINIPTNLNIEDLLVDTKNRLWIASYGDGAYLLDFNKNKLTNFQENKTDPFAIHYNDMLSLYKDNTGIIWLGSDGAGASYYDQHLIKFNVLTNKQMPKNVNIDVVRSICTDTDDNMWIGTSGKGLTFIDNKNNIYKTLSTNNSNLASNRIISLCHSGNDLWIGHQGYGLNIKEPSGEFKYFPEIANYTIWRILKQTPQRSWLCTENNGLLLFDKSKGILETYTSDNSALTTNNIKAIARGNLDVLWLGTENHGVFKLNQKTKSITKLDVINEPLKSLLYKDQMLWIGTYGKGLLKYDAKTKTLTNYTTEHGLPNNVIYGILSDNTYDNLWLSSNIGLTRFNLTDKTNEPIIENYNNYDGLQALEFNTGAYYKSNNGVLYFGGLDGINWFNPSQISLNTVKPKTIISKLEIFSKDEPLIQNNTYKYNQNTVTFTFSSLHFSQPERNLFKYKLENHDNEWIESGNINTAHYTNLPPNDYEFKVISSNYDGLWNEVPEIYKFTILKPWYLTNWAKLSYAILILLSIYFIYKYLKWRWHMKMQLSFEHDETERLKKLNDFKTKLYTNISHEFRTPLTLISGPIDKQLSSNTLSKEDKDELTIVKRNANRLLNLVNQMLDLSKIESGNLKLKVSEGNLSMLLKQLALAFQYKAQEKQINFSYNIVDIKTAWFDKDIIEKTVSNLLSNAIKYAHEKGNVKFEAAHQDGQIIISVINNGNTLSNEDLPKLFQRFYQANKKTDGAGIGLSLVKELAILSHGNIVAHTMNEDDIQFIITLPIERSYYNQSEIIFTQQTNIELFNNASKTNNLSSKENHIPNTDKPLLLIVEDNIDIRAFIKSNFESHYNIVEASNGKQGIAIAIKDIPDIIISDIMMPITDGIELCNTLKHDQRTSHIPIILLTAKVGEENEIEGLKTGADDYITKPFTIEKLRIRIEKLIQLRQQLQERYSHAFNFETKEIEISSAEHQFLQRLQDVLEEHITEPDFNADIFSKKMLMNRMQLHRKLKALTNLTTSEFLRSQRLKLAVELLQRSDTTIAETAYQVGFNTPSYFIKSFKKTYGCTPNEYISNS